MATWSTTPSFDATAQHLRDLNERLLDAGRRVGVLHLDTFEKTVHGVTAAQQRLAEQSSIDAQVEITREVARAQTAAARQLLG
jgi:hypothetical protein